MQPEVPAGCYDGTRLQVGVVLRQLGQVAAEGEVCAVQDRQPGQAGEGEPVQGSDVEQVGSVLRGGYTNTI